MKLTVIPEDNMVVVDGEGLLLDVTADANIHAIQWDGDTESGEIEYKDGRPNEVISTDKIAQYLPLVTSHADAKAKMETDRLKQEADDTAYNALPTTKRKVAYDTEIPIGDQLDEILRFIDAQPTKRSEMQAIIDISKDIKDRFPKE
jgi:hypothetical protein|tara:strand:+ start:1681 stop:2121 length:441 start_codon:yes stop_codon:yes gene_type:complete